MVKKIGRTQASLLLRTDFADAAAWKALSSEIQKPVGEFRARVTPMSHPAYDGVTVKQITRLASAHHAFVFVADRVALEQREHPILVVDVADEPGRSFRVMASEAWSVENNLSIGNMDFDEFADAVDDANVFRGFTGASSKNTKKSSTKDSKVRKKPQDRAQALALRGEIEPAICELLALRAKGDTRARASLAEIAAYQGEWKDALHHAEAVLGSPFIVSTGNVYDGMLSLVALSGRELGAWTEVARIARLAETKLPKKERELSREIKALAAFARRRGKGRLFPWLAPRESAEKDFQRCLEELSKDKKRFATPTERRDHLFAVARACDAYAGGVALYDDEKTLPSNSFDVTLFVASALARRGRTKEAWDAIRSKLHFWWPVENTQMVPIELLTDEAIAPLMTAERRETVLRTPRGPEGPAGS